MLVVNLGRSAERSNPKRPILQKTYEPADTENHRAVARTTAEDRDMRRLFVALGSSQDNVALGSERAPREEGQGMAWRDVHHPNRKDKPFASLLSHPLFSIFPRLPPRWLYDFKLLTYTVTAYNRRPEIFTPAADKRLDTGSEAGSRSPPRQRRCGNVAFKEKAVREDKDLQTFLHSRDTLSVIRLESWFVWEEDGSFVLGDSQSFLLA
ncbi:hypothetical protein BaRGS_00001661 [Batillaria attramentaria]|uniref:Uncharacterized protein n=1 Tax=Batillaria attramentaria TaxID=370345 RepID=A0ABD0M4G2_9CAEN